MLCVTLCVCVYVVLPFIEFHISGIIQYVVCVWLSVSIMLLRLIHIIFCCCLLVCFCHIAWHLVPSRGSNPCPLQWKHGVLTNDWTAREVLIHVVASISSSLLLIEQYFTVLLYYNLFSHSPRQNSWVFSFPAPTLGTIIIKSLCKLA